jgi:ABC-type branched-subunit amino acid transport system ATPase component
MYVREIRIGKFRHLEGVVLGPFSEPPGASEVVVLAGPNGGGKSSVLELVSHALSDAWSLKMRLGRTFADYSFEVAIGLTGEERELVRQHLESTGASYAEDVLEYLREKGLYYRAFNFPDGEYTKNQPLYNQIHSWVTLALRDHYKRSLGFFLRSDRSYPSRKFQRDRIFEYRTMTEVNHIWRVGFELSEAQYADVYDYLVLQRYHYIHQLGIDRYRGMVGSGGGGSAGPDPLGPYEDLLRWLFPGYALAEKAEEVPTDLFVRLPDGEVIPFGDLSSGEQEVFFLLAFFLRHNVTNAIIVIDEPGLHLHPQLARLLVRSMQSVRPGNQIWLGTHNAEIIDEAGRDRVHYLMRDEETGKCSLVRGSDEAEAVQALRDMFGLAGYIGVARTIVFLEGEDSSADRKVFSSLFSQSGGQVKLVPCGSVENLPRVNAAVLAILESNLGWIRFYAVRDRDYLTEEMAAEYERRSSGKIRVLRRKEIENYLLDENIIAAVQRRIYNQAVKAEDVLESLRSVARGMAGEVLRDMVAFRLRMALLPGNLSVGEYLRNQEVVSGSGEWNEEKVRGVTDWLWERAKGVVATVGSAADRKRIEETVRQCQEEIGNALEGEGWRVVFPGKRLLEEYTKVAGLGKPIVLQNSIIKELAGEPDAVAVELRELMAALLQGGSIAKDGKSGGEG